MQKKMVFAAVAIALVAAGCGKKAPAPSNTTASVSNQQSNSQPTNQVNGQQTTLNNLLAMGKPQKCTVTYTVNNTQNQGTVYIDGSNVRMDTTYELNGAQKNFSVISDGKYTYLWTNDSTTGLKVPVQKNSTSTQASGESKLRQDLDPNHPYQYDCSGWTVDTSEFMPPSTISFKEMTTEATGPVESQGTSVNKAKACAACDYAGAKKAQCLASLGCN